MDNPVALQSPLMPFGETTSGGDPASSVSGLAVPRFPMGSPEDGGGDSVGALDRFGFTISSMNMPTTRRKRRKRILRLVYLRW